MVREALSMRRDPEGERKGKVIQGSGDDSEEDAIAENSLRRMGGNLETADEGWGEKEKVRCRCCREEGGQGIAIAIAIATASRSR
jgi:hypothetical protein